MAYGDYKKGMESVWSSPQTVKANPSTAKRASKSGHVYSNVISKATTQKTGDVLTHTPHNIPSDSKTTLAKGSAAPGVIKTEEPKAPASGGTDVGGLIEDINQLGQGLLVKGLEIYTKMEKAKTKSEWQTFQNEFETFHLEQEKSKTEIWMKLTSQVVDLYVDGKIDDAKYKEISDKLAESLTQYDLSARQFENHLFPAAKAKAIVNEYAKNKWKIATPAPITKREVVEARIETRERVSSMAMQDSLNKFAGAMRASHSMNIDQSIKDLISVKLDAFVKDKTVSDLGADQVFVEKLQHLKDSKLGNDPVRKNNKLYDLCMEKWPPQKITTGFILRRTDTETLSEG